VESSLHDARNGTGADVGSDKRLVTGEMELKIAAKPEVKQQI
jgi:hypothetical protein